MKGVRPLMMKADSGHRPSMTPTSLHGNMGRGQVDST